MPKMTYQELTAAIMQLVARVDAMEAFLAGAVALLGKDEVLKAGRDAAAEQVAETERVLSAQVESGVKDGWLRPIQVSGLKSLVVGVEVVGGQPHRMQVIPEGIRPADRGTYIGRSVGEEFVAQSPAGPVTTKVTEIYEVDEDRRREVIAEHQKATPNEPAAPTEGGPVVNDGRAPGDDLV